MGMDVDEDHSRDGYVLAHIVDSVDPTPQVYIAVACLFLECVKVMFCLELPRFDGTGFSPSSSHASATTDETADGYATEICSYSELPEHVRKPPSRIQSLWASRHGSDVIPVPTWVPIPSASRRAVRAVPSFRAKHGSSSRLPFSGAGSFWNSVLIIPTHPSCYAHVSVLKACVAD